jgi:hypothetical protein
MSDVRTDPAPVMATHHLMVAALRGHVENFDRSDKPHTPGTSDVPSSATTVDPIADAPAAAPLAQPQIAPPTPEEDPVNLTEELLKALEISRDDLGARIAELSYDWAVDGLDVRGNFYYLALRDGKPTVDDFITLLYHNVVKFCLTRRDRQRHIDDFQRTGKLHHMQDMFDKAKKLLIRSQNSAKTVGEPGEIILYILLDAMLKAPQMCCKMSLKTSEEMPVHGSDAIHIAFDTPSETLILYWGESKLYAELSGALDEVCDSITKFRTAKDGKTPRERDIKILCDYMDMEDGPPKEAVLNFFDPYSERSNRVREVYACFVGFDFSFFNRIARLTKTEVEATFKEEYLDRIRTACKLFAAKIHASNLHEVNFHFFLIPLPCVETFRRLYLERIRG